VRQDAIFAEPKTNRPSKCGAFPNQLDNQLAWHVRQEYFDRQLERFKECCCNFETRRGYSGKNNIANQSNNHLDNTNNTYPKTYEISLAKYSDCRSFAVTAKPNQTKEATSTFVWWLPERFPKPNIDHPNKCNVNTIRCNNQLDFQGKKGPKRDQKCTL